MQLFQSWDPGSSPGEDMQHEVDGDKSPSHRARSVPRHESGSVGSVKIMTATVLQNCAEVG